MMEEWTLVDDDVKVVYDDNSAHYMCARPMGAQYCYNDNDSNPKAEIRTTDPITGGQKGSKLARFSLVPADFLWSLAEHYGRGALKYMEYGKCSCAQIANDLRCLIPASGVETVMNIGSGSITQSTLNDNAPIAESGQDSTSPARTVALRHIRAALRQNGDEWHGNTVLAFQSTTKSLPNLAGFVARPNVLGTLITVLRQVRFEDRSATDVIWESDLLKSATPNGSIKHWFGCLALEATTHGDRNWERGYKWSLSFDALERHMHQWLMGEDVDAETGTHHLVCVVWHTIALWWWQKRGKGTDDIRIKEGV